MLNSSLGLSATDISILTLLKKDVYWEVLSVLSAPSTALHAVSKWPRSHLQRAISPLRLGCAGDGTYATGQQIKNFLGRQGAGFGLFCRGVEL